MYSYDSATLNLILTLWNNYPLAGFAGKVFYTLLPNSDGGPYPRISDLPPPSHRDPISGERYHGLTISKLQAWVIDLLNHTGISSALRPYRTSIGSFTRPVTKFLPPKMLEAHSELSAPTKGRTAIQATPLMSWLAAMIFISIWASDRDQMYQTARTMFLRCRVAAMLTSLKTSNIASRPGTALLLVLLTGLWLTITSHRTNARSMSCFLRTRAMSGSWCERHKGFTAKAEVHQATNCMKEFPLDPLLVNSTRSILFWSLMNHGSCIKRQIEPPKDSIITSSKRFSSPL